MASGSTTSSSSAAAAANNHTSTTTAAPTESLDELSGTNYAQPIVMSTTTNPDDQSSISVVVPVNAMVVHDQASHDHNIAATTSKRSGIFEADAAGGSNTTVLDDDQEEVVQQAITNKYCIGRANRGTSWTTVLDKGMRRHMEDKLVAVPRFMSLPCDTFGGCTSPDCLYAAQDSRVHYFAVFDGHGGAEVSTFCASTLHEILAEEWKSETGVDEWGPRWEIALCRAYEKVDDACKDRSFGSAGSTALVVLVSACQIIAANCGDSRAVLARKNEVIPLTNDHKPDSRDEVKRILIDGGCIMNVDGVLRVDGVLAMTRSIGDHPLKPWVSSVPEMTFTTRTEEDDCLIIASDGLWDVMSSEEVGRLGRELMGQRRREVASGERSSPSVANLLLEEARSKLSSDNIAVIAVDLKRPRRRQMCP